MTRLLAVTSFILIVVSSCQPKMNTPEGDFTIKGNVTGADTIIFEKIEAESLQLVDTIFTDNGKFIATDTLDQSAFYLLRTPEGEGINLLIESGEDIKVNGLKSGWSENYSIEGSKGSNQIQELNNKLRTFEANLEYIYEEARDAKKEDFIEIQDRFNTIINDYTNDLKAFIDSNLESKISVLALFQTVKGENILNLYEDFNSYEKVHQYFLSKWPKSSHTALLGKIVNQAYAQNFTMEDIDGNSFSLDELDGKLILLDFWASWCGPCRRANPKIVSLYNKYHQNGLEIVGISLDGTSRQTEPKKDWINAVQEDGLTWTQVSDLKGWDSEIREKYEFRGIPHTVLIDTNGRIIGENLNINQLEEEIEKRLNL